MQRLSIRHLLLILIASVATRAAAGDAGLDQRIANIEADYHVRIHYRFNRAAFFPDAWREPALRLRATPVHPQDVETLVPIIEQFLAAHPKTVIQNNLDHIYLLGKLSFKGKEYGGTHDGKSMYIIYDRTLKCDATFMLQRLHSEFSSILMCYHPFPESEWLLQNPDGFSYTGTGFEMVDDPDRYSSDEPLYANGFLCKYSQSSLENDFNMMSAMLFTEAAELDRLTDGHPRLRTKRDIARSYYQKVSSDYVFN